MAIKGWYMTSPDGSSLAGGVPASYHGMVTFTGASSVTLDGGNIELVYNDANVTSKEDLFRAIDRLWAAINNDQWPPNGQN
jgi:hypothetical protein